MNVSSLKDIHARTTNSIQNLLRTLTESQVRPSPDLRLLLSAVKDARVSLVTPCCPQTRTNGYKFP
jgi:hypothetical protein